MFGFAFYRPFKYKIVTHARVFSLKPKFTITKNQGLFLANSFHHLNRKFGYENMCSWNKIKNEKIELPIVKNNVLDFDFIEKFIALLEAERLAELEAYFLATGLKNYTLTAQELKVLSDFDNSNFRDFKVTDIFNVKNSGNILSRDIIPNSGTTPYLCAGSDNNSVSSYISYNKNYIDKGNCIFIGGKTFVVSFQENDFYSNDSHNLILYMKNEKDKNKFSQLYLATCINKSLRNKYSWGDSISNRKIQKDSVSLPSINEKVDYENMEPLISAIQKLVIKDVVLYADKRIEETKNVISREN